MMNGKQFVDFVSGRVRHYNKHILTHDDRGLTIIPTLQIKVTENDNSIFFHKGDVELMLEKFKEWNDANYHTV